MRVLVTGSSGQIGSYAVEGAKAAGHDVAGLDLRPAAWTTVQGDIRDHETCLSTMAGCDAVTHCAAQVSVQASVEDPAEDASHNVVGTIRLLDAARRAGVRFAAAAATSTARLASQPSRLIGRRWTPRGVKRPRLHGEGRMPN